MWHAASGPPTDQSESAAYFETTLAGPPATADFDVQRSAFDVQRFFFHRFLYVTLLASAALIPNPSTSAAGFPTLSGNVSGELQLLEGQLTIPWRATAQPHAAGATRFAVDADLPEDGEFRASLVLDRTEAQGAWRINEARAGAAMVLRRIAPALLPDLPQLDVTGEMTLTGDGDWCDGQPLGPLNVGWTAPTVTGTDPELSVEQLSLNFTLNSGWGGGTLQGDGTLEAARVTVAGVVLEEIAAAYSLHDDGTIRVTHLRARAFGGVIDFAPFSWSADVPETTFGLEFDGLDLELLAAAMPDVIRNARGGLRGQARFRWRDDLGLVPIGGELHEIESANVQVTLAPQPGFLTGNMPRRFQILPDRLGRLAREWLAPKNPAYPTLERIEMGREPLAVDDFVVQFFPPDDPLGRTASIRIEGHPREDPLLEKVVLTINLSGPLTDLLRLGLENSIQFDVTKPGGGNERK